MPEKSYSPFFRFGSFVVRQTLGRYLPIRCEGREHLPKGPFILACNHASLLDPPLLCAYIMAHTRTMISPAATKGLFVWPLSWMFRRMGAFVVDRQDNQNLTTVRQILRTLRTRPILIFPEGGIPEEGPREEGRLGVGFIAKKSGVPVIPTAILGTEQSLPRGKRWIRKAPVTIRFGEPLCFHKEDPQDYRTVTQEVMKGIFKLKTAKP